MTSAGFEPPDIQKLIASMVEGLDPMDAAALANHGAAFDDIWRRPAPELRPTPEVVRGFRIRIDLQDTKPPVWRRIDVAGDIELPALHDVIQAAMGWTDSHLHRFRTDNGRNPPEFLTRFDIDEGDEGTPETGVRLDQLVASVGDRLWYDYDFGDGWDHVLRVERVLDAPPAGPMCIAGKLACPPEDCGGVWGYAEIADWVRSGYVDRLRPGAFGSSAEGRAWLPDGWHPDAFDIDAANEVIVMFTSEPVDVVDEVASLLAREQRYGSRELRDVLAHPIARGQTSVGDSAAADLTAVFRVFLDVIGDGVDLTAAGYLKPGDVEQIAQRTGIANWWIGKANREDLTPPVATIRATARSLGLVSVRRGRLAPTASARHAMRDPQSLLGFIRSRLPIGRSDAERHAGWCALAVAARETPAELWSTATGSTMFSLGWRASHDTYAMPPSESATLDVLELLAGAARDRWRPQGVYPDLAAFARSVIRG